MVDWLQRAVRAAFWYLSMLCAQYNERCRNQQCTGMQPLSSWDIFDDLRSDSTVGNRLSMSQARLTSRCLWSGALLSVKTQLISVKFQLKIQLYENTYMKIQLVFIRVSCEKPSDFREDAVDLRLYPFSFCIGFSFCFFISAGSSLDRGGE